MIRLPKPDRHQPHAGTPLAFVSDGTKPEFAEETMRTHFLTTLLATTVLLVSFKTFAADDDSSLQAELNTKMQTMQQEKAGLSVENEVVNLNKEEYEESEKQTVIELQKLHTEIKDMERQTAQLNQGAEKSRLDAVLAAKKLELRQREKAESQKKLAFANAQKRQAEHRKSQLTAKVEMTEQQLKQSRENTREAEAGIREALKQQSQLQKRLEQTKKMIAQEKRRQESMRSKKTRVSQQNAKLKSAIAKLAARNN
jgi:chromosome segregation ATPase